MFDRIREDVRSVFDRDPAARSIFEVLTCYPGLHAVWGHRISHWFWKRGWFWLARFHSHWGRWLTGIEIHPGATLGRRLFIDHGFGVVIGETAEIGDDVTIYQGVTLGGTSLHEGKRHPTIGDHVVIGAGAKVLGGFLVGAHARIGSNSVVVKEVPAGATVVGIPGRVIQNEAPSAAVNKVAARIGFDAYGLSRDLPDPVASAFADLIDHVQKLDAQMTQVCRVLNEMDRQMPELALHRLQLPDWCKDAAARSSGPTEPQ